MMLLHASVLICNKSAGGEIQRFVLANQPLSYVANSHFHGKNQAIMNEASTIQVLSLSIRAESAQLYPAA